MGHDLTKRYSSVFETRRLAQPFRFARDVYAFGKLRELSSFVVWETLHRLGLFPKRRYLTFTDHEPVALHDGTPVHGDRFGDLLNRALHCQKVQAIRCLHDWNVLFIHRNREVYGSVAPRVCDLYRGIDGDSLRFVRGFPRRITAVFVSGRGTLLVCIKGAVYTSLDDGASFQKTLTFGSSESSWRHNNAVTETPDGTLIIGEYGNVRNGSGWKQLAYLYFSSDGGATWTQSDFLLRHGTNKHVHVVRYSKLLNRVLVSDGDNYKKLWMSRLWDGHGPWEWTPVNRFHIQMGGYTAIAESDGKLLFGTDYQGGTNFVVESTDGQTFTKKVVPDPYRRSPIDNMAVRKSGRGNEVWANLPYSTAGTRCLLMYTADGGRRWHRVIEYSRSSHTVWLISSATDIPDALYVSVEDARTRTRAVYRIADS